MLITHIRSYFLVCASTLSDEVNTLRSSTQDTLCENCYITKGGISPFADSYMDNKYDDTGEDYFYMVTFKLNATFPEAQFLLDGL